MQDRHKGDVTIVEDDISLREALGRLLTEVGYTVRLFPTAEAYLETAAPCHCLLLDVRLPGMSGPELQKKMSAGESTCPIVFITGHGDVPMAVEAMKNGAVDFLLKPVDEDLLIAAVNKALKMCRQRRLQADKHRQILESLTTLTPREKDVMLLVVAGQPNKIIAEHLGIALQTVKIHRGRVMAKLQVESIVDLVRLVEKAGLGPK